MEAGSCLLGLAVFPGLSFAPCLLPHRSPFPTVQPDPPVNITVLQGGMGEGWPDHYCPGWGQPPGEGGEPRTVAWDQATGWPRALQSCLPASGTWSLHPGSELKACLLVCRQSPVTRLRLCFLEAMRSLRVFFPPSKRSIGASLVAQMVKRLPAMRETWV